MASSARTGAAIVTEAAISAAALVIVRKLSLVKELFLPLKRRMLCPPVAATNKTQARVDPGSARSSLFRRCGKSQRPIEAKLRLRATGSIFQRPLRLEVSQSDRSRQRQSTTNE